MAEPLFHVANAQIVQAGIENCETLREYLGAFQEGQLSKEYIQMLEILYKRIGLVIAALRRQVPGFSNARLLQRRRPRRTRMTYGLARL